MNRLIYFKGKTKIQQETTGDGKENNSTKRIKEEDNGEEWKKKTSWLLLYKNMSFPLCRTHLCLSFKLE